ncbi:MAG: MBL fold metallo-hydrolase [Candidatus Helarchaeota archaeon]|nr:MBL fold metallo-hydrolase [Candidatus Helarchaeota archaeon]
MAIFRDTGTVADGIYLVDTFIWGIAKQHAVYIIQSSDQTALIDTGVRKTMKIILKELENLKIDTLDYILMTHSHIDHCGAVRQFAKMFSKAEICFPHLATELVETYQKKAEKFGFSNPVKLLREGDLIKLDADFILEVLETPGHVSDHISFLDQSHQILFVGDACGAHHLGANFSRPTAYAPDFQHEEYIQTLMRFQKMNPTGLAIASYGFASDQDGIRCIEKAINDYHAWRSVVIEAVRENPDTGYIARVLLKKFGRSPGEIIESRPERWVIGILSGIARGFINSLELVEK